jgi:uncharacterized membrane protein
MYTYSDTLHKVQAGEVWLTYLLYALFFTAPIGILLSVGKAFQYHHLLKQENRPNAKDLEMLVTHYDWLNRTALVTLLLAMIAVGTAYYFVGYLFAVAALVWWVYRLGRGVVALMEYKAPPIAV